MSNKIRIYISHPIRGAKGVDATDEDMRLNNTLASQFGGVLQIEFPNVEFYVPADHDEFVLLAYNAKFMSEEEILYVDCEIIDRCQMVLAYIPEQYVSGGMLVEILHAQRTNTPVLFTTNINDGVAVLRHYLEGLKT